MSQILFAFIFLLVLKATGLATMSLWVMFSPLLILVFFFGCMFLVGALAGLYGLFRDIRAKRERESRNKNKPDSYY